MNEIETKEVVEYWVVTSEHDKDTMMALYEKARYSDCLFFGHIILEKIIKALVVAETKTHAPYKHNLDQLWSLCGSDSSEDEKALLIEVNEFNIRARYPEDKLRFYKMCTKKYTDNYLPRIIDLYSKLCQEVKRKIS